MAKVNSMISAAGLENVRLYSLEQDSFMFALESLLTPNYIGGVEDPVNIAIMDVENFIRDRRAMPVSSTLVYEPSTNLYHPDGLYSEEVFGLVGSPERMLRFGYVDLNTTIFNPKLFKLICQLGGIYKDVMSGAAWATFDPVKKDFVRVNGDPTLVKGANTGYSFFLHHFNELVFRVNNSTKRDERIEVLEQYKERAQMVRYLIEPAGLRDIANDASGRLIQDDVNKLYTALIIMVRSIPKGTQSVLYDPVRYQIQSKAQEIFEYIENFLDGKRGFIQGSFARRKVAMGTRNVITASTMMAASPEDPQLQKTDDVMVGVYQTSKGLQPFFKHVYMSIFANIIFKTDSVTQVALSDPKTGKLVYTAISPAVRDIWTSSDGIDKLINSFRNTDLRRKPVLIPDTEGKSYALLLVYDDGDQIALCRSVDDLESRWPRKVDRSKLRAITYIELFYIITETISAGKHAIITRYPVIEQGSSYIAELHVVSTTPARSVEMIDLLNPDFPPTTLRQYPCVGAAYMDAMMVHPSRLAALGGDHDGDKCSCEMVWSRDANRECADYLQSTRSVINTDLRFITGGSNYLIDATLHNLTHR
jgi:hypothetical protein